MEFSKNHNIAQNKINGISTKEQSHAQKDEAKKKNEEEKPNESDKETENEAEKEISIDHVQNIIVKIPCCSECKADDTDEWLQ